MLTNFIVRSGITRIDANNIRFSGNSGFGWSSWFYGRAFNLYIDVTNVSPSNDDHAYYAFPLRCLAD